MRDDRTECSIYLDYQATTPTDPRVVEAMWPFWNVEFGNPHSSYHAFGWRAEEAVEDARGRIAGMIGAETEEIVFTSGATEANNLAILGLLQTSNTQRSRVIVSAIEHKCVIEVARQLSRFGYEVVYAPVTKAGCVDTQVLRSLINDNTAFVSVMIVNNEIGTIQPTREISDLCRKVGAVFHADAAQAPCAMAIDVADLGVDMLSMSSHKIYGPKGIGALFVSNSIRPKMRPLMHGGGQEGGLRSGTVPVPLAVGFGKAASILLECHAAEAARLETHRKAFLQTLQSRLEFQINGGGHPGNLNFRLPEVDAEILIAKLQPKVAVSTGSACTAGNLEPSHVLTAIGLTSEESSECIRVSFGRFTEEKDVYEAAEIIAEAADSLRCVK